MKELLTFLQKRDAMMSKKSSADRRSACLLIMSKIRALIKHLDGISDEDIAGLNIPTAQPLVYEFDDDMKPIRHYYLGNQEEIAKAIAAVAAQGKAKH